mmetsp:Transcript_37236/g.99101  ORF Transcript_37236/g.99101 Transcript_37236/m.99101 type:complete len:1895 (+) Transcript_37236:92-5776(+)
MEFEDLLAGLDAQRRRLAACKELSRVAADDALVQGSEHFETLVTAFKSLPCHEQHKLKNQLNGEVLSFLMAAQYAEKAMIQKAPEEICVEEEDFSSNNNSPANHDERSHCTACFIEMGWSTTQSGECGMISRSSYEDQDGTTRADAARVYSILSKKATNDEGRPVFLANSADENQWRVKLHCGRRTTESPCGPHCGCGAKCGCQCDSCARMACSPLGGQITPRTLWTNDEGRPVLLGNDVANPRQKGSDKFFCGTWIGDASGKTCGTASGPQCASCARFTEQVAARARQDLEHCCQCCTRDGRAGFSYFEGRACAQCQERECQFSFVKVNAHWRRVNMETGAVVDGGAEGEVIETLEFPKHITRVPLWVVGVESLRKLDVHDCIQLTHIPMDDLLKLPKLEEVDCGGCINLISPPHEICEAGGKRILQFMRDSRADGECSLQMTLFLLGDGESGKTSVIKALKSPNNTSERLHEDSRTVGIDISTWVTPGGEVEFKVLDLAGQAIYSKTHQLFLQQRAVYLLVWRAHESLLEDDSELSDRIVHWMESLQLRVPGSMMLLVATHIDSVSAEDLNTLCGRVQGIVQQTLSSFKAAHKEGVPVLRVYGEGESARVNCLMGDGIESLRKNITSFAMTAPWYKEVLPGDWIRVRQRIIEMASQGRTFIEMGEFQQLMLDHKICNLGLPVVTNFFHETGVIRYFGEFSDSKGYRPLPRAVKAAIRKQIPNADLITFEIDVVHRQVLSMGYEIDLEEVQHLRKITSILDFGSQVVYIIEMIQSRAAECDVDKKAQNLLQNTVFISPTFMINVMKGLIRHDRDALLDYFSESNDRVMMRRVNRLSVWGRLHRDLIPYLWPSTDASKAYWNEVRGLKEGSLWDKDVISNQDDLDRAVALLEGFDLVAYRSKDQEYMVPSLLKQSRTQISSDVFNVADCPFYYKYSYSTKLPPGAFDAIVVRIAKFSTHVEYSPVACVFYQMGQIGQIFSSSDTKRSSSEGSPTLYTICVRSSSKDLLRQAAGEVEKMESFFPGLHRNHLEIELHDSHTDSATLTVSKLSSKVKAFHRFISSKPQEASPRRKVQETSQVLILADDEEFAVSLRTSILGSSRNHDLTTIDIQLPTDDVKYPKNVRVVLVCLTSTIGSCAQSCLQFKEHLQANCLIIPVIAPGFEIKDYMRWWPSSMPEFEDRKLFVDFRDASNKAAMGDLFGQVLKYLSEWRSKPEQKQEGGTNSFVFRKHQKAKNLSTYDTDPDVIECSACCGTKVDAHANNRFSRARCLELWNDYVARRNLELSKPASEQAAVPPLEPLTCQNCFHEHEVADLLSWYKIPTMVPCPQCVERGSFSPGSFDVADCRLLFTEGDRQRVGMVKCSVCGESSRVMDVVPPEVFGSYNWGAKKPNGEYSTQEMVVKLLRDVEFHTDLVCWIDVEGGMGAGQDLIKEMLHGIIKSNVVVVFLSDAYVNSPNCKREFALACRFCKYLVPVLVPESASHVFGSNVGWTGRGAEDPQWWEHAERICQDPTHPDDPSARIDWSILAMYKPIQFPVLEGDYGESLNQVIKRIMQRLHRSARLNNNTISSQKRLLSINLWARVVRCLFQELGLDGAVGQDAAGRGKDPTPEQLAHIKKMFDMYDVDSSGSMDQNKVRLVFRSLGLECTDEEVQAFFQEVDLDGSGAIDFDEFCAAVGPRLVVNEALKGNIERVFDVFDAGKKGKLGPEEVRAVMMRLEAQLSKRVTDEEVEDMVVAMDADRDGLISQSEFLELLVLATQSYEFFRLTTKGGREGTRGAEEKSRGVASSLECGLIEEGEEGLDSALVSPRGSGPAEQAPAAVARTTPPGPAPARAAVRDVVSEITAGAVAKVAPSRPSVRLSTRATGAFDDLAQVQALIASQHSDGGARDGFYVTL